MLKLLVTDGFTWLEDAEGLVPQLHPNQAEVWQALLVCLHYSEQLAK